MSETETPAPTDPPKTETPVEPVAKARDDVPVENQIGEWKRKAEKAEKEAADLRAWREEQETAKLSEIEKATKAQADAEQRANAAEQRAMSMERTAWVTAAARDAKFTDPGDAALAVDLAGIEDPAAAKKAVEKLAKDKPHWLSQAKPAGFGTIGDRGQRDEVPVDKDGNPDVRAGLGRELMKGLLQR